MSFEKIALKLPNVFKKSSIKEKIEYFLYVTLKQRIFIKTHISKSIKNSCDSSNFASFSKQKKEFNHRTN